MRIKMKNNGDRAGCVLFLIYFIIAAVIIACIVGYGWIVASSNLPDWLKYFLLTR